MADNVRADAGSGGELLATDDIGGVQYPRAKIVLGADNTNDGDVSSSNPMPVNASSLPLPTGAATSANQLPDGHNVTVDNASGASAVNIQDGGNSITVDDGGGALTVDGTVGVSGTVTVDGSGVTQPVSAASLPLPTGAATSAGQLPDGHNVTIDNASGASAVNIQDGGNSITVDGIITATPSGTQDIQGVDAENAAVSADPVLVGGRYDATPRTLNDGDAGGIALDPDGAVQVSDGGNSLTVDGTVGVSGTVTVDGSGVTQPVSAASLPLPTGAATSANQLPDGHNVTIDNASGASAVNIQDGGNSITVDASSLPLPTGASTASNQTTGNSSLSTIAGAVSGTEMQVDVVGALPAGTNNIGDVDVVSNTPGTGATNLGKAQDSAAGATDTGVAILAVRDDEQAAMTPADGDYTTLRTDRHGNLKVTQLPDATSAVQYGVIDAASSGDNTLQAAAGAGVKIRVLSVMMISAGTVTARFESGASGTALTGQMNLVANSGFTLPYNPAGWFETADNALLNLELSAAISVDGCFTYVEV